MYNNNINHLYTKYIYLNNFIINNYTKQKINPIKNKFNKNLCSYIYILKKYKNLLNKSFFNRKSKNLKYKKIILINKRSSITLKSGRITNYKIITGISLKNNIIGIGKHKNRISLYAYNKSFINAKKYKYNINFKYDDYKQIKYKNCKFSILNKPENKYNIKMYNNITELIGIKKKKLISHNSKNPINILNSILYNF